QTCPTASGIAARRTFDREPRHASDHPLRSMEACGRRKPDPADSWFADGNYRAAVFPAVDDESAPAGLVRAAASVAQSLSAVCAFEPGFDGGTARLSLSARTVACHALAGMGVVGGLRGLPRALHRHRLDERARRRTGA